MSLLESRLWNCIFIVTAFTTLKLVLRLWENVVDASLLLRHWCYAVATSNILVDVASRVTTLELMSRHSSPDIATLEFGVATFLN